jgi:hypothetical protein
MPDIRLIQKPDTGYLVSGEAVYPTGYFAEQQYFFKKKDRTHL